MNHEEKAADHDGDVGGEEVNLELEYEWMGTRKRNRPWDQNQDSDEEQKDPGENQNRTLEDRATQSKLERYRPE